MLAFRGHSLPASVGKGFVPSGGQFGVGCGWDVPGVPGWPYIGSGRAVFRFVRLGRVSPWVRRVSDRGGRVSMVQNLSCAGKRNPSTSGTIHRAFLKELQ